MAEYPRLQVLAMILENRLKFSKICEGWFPIYEVRINASHKASSRFCFFSKAISVLDFLGF